MWETALQDAHGSSVKASWNLTRDERLPALHLTLLLFKQVYAKQYFTNNVSGSKKNLPQ